MKLKWLILSGVLIVAIVVRLIQAESDNEVNERNNLLLLSETTRATTHVANPIIFNHQKSSPVAKIEIVDQALNQQACIMLMAELKGKNRKLDKVLEALLSYQSNPKSASKVSDIRFRRSEIEYQINDFQDVFKSKVYREYFKKIHQCENFKFLVLLDALFNQNQSPNAFYQKYHLILNSLDTVFNVAISYYAGVERGTNWSTKLFVIKVGDVENIKKIDSRLLLAQLILCLDNNDYDVESLSLLHQIFHQIDLLENPADKGLVELSHSILSLFSALEENYFQHVFSAPPLDAKSIDNYFGEWFHNMDAFQPNLNESYYNLIAVDFLAYISELERSLQQELIQSMILLLSGKSESILYLIAQFEFIAHHHNPLMIKSIALNYKLDHFQKLGDTSAMILVLEELRFIDVNKYSEYIALLQKQGILSTLHVEEFIDFIKLKMEDIDGWNDSTHDKKLPNGLLLMNYELLGQLNEERGNNLIAISNYNDCIEYYTYNGCSESLLLLISHHQSEQDLINRFEYIVEKNINLVDENQKRLNINDDIAYLLDAGFISNLEVLNALFVAYKNAGNAALAEIIRLAIVDCVENC